MGQTSIEWTSATWNPIRARLPEDIKLHQAKGLKVLDAGRWGYHCEHVSTECINCYAETMNKRTLPAWGTGLAYNVPNRSRVEIFMDEAELVKPLKWKSPLNIFPCSMTDWHATFVPEWMRDRMLAVMALTPRHAYQTLTKRAVEQRRYFQDITRNPMQRLAGDIAEAAGYLAGLVGETVFARRIDPDNGGWPLPNLHLGVSVGSDEFRARISDLIFTPAALRWISYEPALGPLDLGPLISGINWVVIGGESGPGARPFDIAWARDVIAQCRAAGTPAFVKQLGAKPFNGESLHLQIHKRTCDGRLYLKFKDRKGGDMEEWPSDIRVREMPELAR